MVASPTGTTVCPTPAATALRDALGRFATGVTVVTTIDEAGRPAGFACQSFTALSLDPPLVLFCPMKTSRTWPLVEASGRFCVNVLGEEQNAVCHTFASRSADKFSAINWTPTESGQPRIEGSLAWFECSVEQVTEGGDHWIVVGRVDDMGSEHGRPLLFHRGGFAQLQEEMIADGAPTYDPFLSVFEPGSWI